jgi:hypothetical protein
MRIAVLSMALMVTVGVPQILTQPVLAQQGGSSSMPKNTGVLPAPVGHRQPRADQVPNEKNLSNPNDPENKEDAALDKKIKSICRGY